MLVQELHVDFTSYNSHLLTLGTGSGHSLTPLVIGKDNGLMENTLHSYPSVETYFRVIARRGLQRTARAATRHMARDPLVIPQVDP